jgi:hypothetical protein
MLSLFVAEAGARRVFAVEESAVHPQTTYSSKFTTIAVCSNLGVTNVECTSLAARDASLYTRCTKVKLAIKRDFPSLSSAPSSSSSSSALAASPSPSTCLSPQSMVELAEQVAKDNGVAATITTLQGTVTSNAMLLPVVDVVLCADVSPWSVRRSLLPDVLLARSHTHTQTHRLTHARTHAHTGSHTHTHTHTHIHTHTGTASSGKGGCCSPTTVPFFSHAAVTLPCGRSVWGGGRIVGAMTCRACGP